MKPYLIPADYVRDNPFAEKHYYKIYHDGSHPVGTRIVKSKGKRPPKKQANTALDIAFDSLYYQAKRKGLNVEEQAAYIQAGLEKLYPANSTLQKYILEKIDKKQRNLWKRIKRFKRKVNMNRWTHFVTLTCDPKKHTEESFRKKLRKCLSNLHTRRGWKYNREMRMWQRQYEGGIWRILSYKILQKSLKRIPKKRKRRNFTSGIA